MTATQDTQLITSVSDLKGAVNALSSGGSTNHADAFTKALDLFDPASTNEKVMVMFTDRVTTSGGNPNTVAALAKSQGVIIYCIGLSGNGGIDEPALNDWASDPDSAYVAITPDDEDLDVSGSTDSICNRRKFKARFIAHYIDNDFACCDITV